MHRIVGSLGKVLHVVGTYLYTVYETQYLLNKITTWCVYNIHMLLQKVFYMGNAEQFIVVFYLENRS